MPKLTNKDLKTESHAKILSSSTDSIYNRIQMSGYAKVKGYDTGTGNGWLFYEIDLIIKNNGQFNIYYDEIECRFYTIEGEREDYDGPLEVDKQVKVQLSPLQSHNHLIESPPAQEYLYKCEVNYPRELCISLKYQNHTVAGPFLTFLPECEYQNNAKLLFEQGSK